MTTNSNKKKRAQLGMSTGKANNRLRKALMFKFAKELGLTKCFQCEHTIENIDNFSLEHKIPWLDSGNPVELYFDLNNIAFSHRSCNSRAARQTPRNHAKGEKNGRAILKVEDVIKIRELRKQGRTHKSLANEFGVARETITKLIDYRSWKYISN